MEQTPQTSKKKLSLGKKILIGIGAITLIGVIANAGEETGASNDSSQAASAPTEKTTEAAAKKIEIGEPLKTDYFEVTVSQAALTKKLNTGNEFSDEVAGDGNQFLVITTKFKNIDDESRMLIDGSVFIDYNGKNYEFDKSETVMAEGYGLLLDQINPLTSKTTKLVYKLPAEIKGPAFYKPGRAADNERIFLGDLK